MYVKMDISGMLTAKEAITLIDALEILMAQFKLSYDFTSKGSGDQMRAEKTVECMRDKLSTLIACTTNREYRWVLTATKDALDWVLGDQMTSIEYLEKNWRPFQRRLNNYEL